MIFISIVTLFSSDPGRCKYRRKKEKEEKERRILRHVSAFFMEMDLYGHISDSISLPPLSLSFCRAARAGHFGQRSPLISMKIALPGKHAKNARDDERAA